VETTRIERGRVRVAKHVTTDGVTVSEPAVRQEISIERVPVDRFVEQPSGMRREDHTLIIPVYEEVPVVVTKIKLKEEVRVTTKTIKEERRIPATLRRETVTVQRLPPADSPDNHKERRR